MKFLELKIPPPVVVLLFGLAMWRASTFIPVLSFSFPPWNSYIALALLLTGIISCSAGVREFIKWQTTTDPTRPDSASRIVRSGIYRFSRNPMYLGFFLTLAGWAVYLAHGLAVAILFGFVAYMNRFQIIPEERALAAKFGADFKAYKKSVRRWI